MVIIDKTGIKSSQRLKSLSVFIHRLHSLEGTFTPSSWLLFSSSAQNGKREKKKIGPDSRKAKRKERRGSRDTYEKDMNKFFTIIYHNIYRLHDEKIPTIRRGSEPRQVQLCGVLERPSMNSGTHLPTEHRFPRRNSDFTLQSSHSKYFSSPTALKRRVEFSDTFVEELKFPDMVEDCRFKREKSQKPFNSIVTE